MDHNINALDDIGFVNVFDQFLSIFEELDISGDFPNDSLLVFIQPLKFSDIFQKDHNFGVFRHNKFMGKIGSDVD